MVKKEGCHLKYALLYLSYLLIFFYSCKTDNYLPGFDFKLYKNTPVWNLAKAVQAENIKKINQLLKDKSINVDYQEPKFGHTLLMLAVANNKAKSVEALLQNNAEPNLVSWYQNENSLTIASNESYSESCDTVILSKLIKFGGDLNFLQEYKETSQNGEQKIKSTLLNTAISSGKCLEYIIYLVNKGSNINSYPENDPTESPITYALLTNNLEVAKYLIIDKKAAIPPYVFIRQANISYQGEPEKYLTLTDLLKEQQFKKGTKDYKLREEIIEFLKSRNLK
jgi:uncharacterized protein YajQ (UPF0234 family)